MKASKELITRVYDRLHQELVGLGFVRRRKKDPYTLPLEGRNDFVGWLGAGRSVARGDGALRVQPNVGVLWLPLRKLIKDLGGGNWPATLCGNLGYLMPENSYTEYEFWIQTDDGPSMARLIEDLERYGIPYMRSMASLGAIVEYFELPNAPKWAAPYFLPAIYLLRGDRAAAMRSLEGFLQNEDRRQVIMEDYQQYANRLRRRIEAHEP
jgi:hypothetical protein